MSTIALSLRIPLVDSNEPAAIRGLHWRPLTEDDVDDVVRISQESSLSDHPDWSDSREDVLEEFGHGYIDLEHDSLGAITDAGELVAWGLVIYPPTQQTLVRSILTGTVAPGHRGRGIGRALLEWQRGRGLQQFATSDKELPGWIVVSADDRAPTAGRLLKRAGFAPNRWFYNLSRESSAPIREVPVADDFRIVPYSSEYSAAAHSARDEAFRGHGSSQPMSDEQWDSMMSMSTFTPGLSFLAIDSNQRIVGMLLTLLTDEVGNDGAGPSGYVWVIGVTPDSRRQGVATGMIAAHLHALKGADVSRSVLDVATGQTGDELELFLGMGYRERSRSGNYVAVY